MVSAQVYQLQYLFYRALTVAGILILFMAATQPRALLHCIKNIGWADLTGAGGLAIAMFGFILAITLTTVANTLFMLAVAPFIAALLGIIFLGERIPGVTWAAMVIALVGIFIMVAEGLTAGNLTGNLLALLSASGFAVFAVSLRSGGSEGQKLTVATMAGIICCLLTMVILDFRDISLTMPPRNIYLSMLHGFLVGVGLILFSVGAQHVPAAQSTLMSLVEIVGGILWVYLPIFGINEIPSLLTIVGGVILLSAIVLDGAWALLQPLVVKLPIPKV
jgi:drug/metabolite transporter (DMT)-like permease